MAEINQPAPVKPVWPARREPHPLKRYPPNRSSEDDRKRREEPQQTDEESTAVDEYV